MTTSVIRKSTEPRPFAQAWPWVVFLTFLFYCNYTARTLLSPLLVYIEQDLNISHSQSTSLLLMQGIGFAISQALTGVLVSFFSPARVVSVSTIAVGFFLVPLPLVNSLEWAWVFFFCFGMSAGVYLGSSIAILGTLVRTEDWGKAIGVHELAPNLGFIFLPIIAQVGLLFTDWRGVFTIVGTMAIISGCTFLRWGKGGETCTNNPSLKGNLFLLTQRNSWIYCLWFIIGMLGEFAIYSVLQLFLVREINFSPEYANLWLFISRLATPLFVLFGGWACDHYKPEKVIFTSFTLHAISLFIMGLSSDTIVVLIGVCIQPLSIAILFPAIFKVMSFYTPMAHQPALTSMIMPVAALVFGGLFPWLLGICGQYYSFALGYVFAGIISAISAFSIFIIKKKHLA